MIGKTRNGIWKANLPTAKSKTTAMGIAIRKKNKPATAADPVHLHLLAQAWRYHGRKA
jgi:hypothetical protein